MSDAGTRPTGRSLLIVLIVATAALMEGLDATIIVTALPKMAETFGTSPIAVSVGLTAYLLSVAILTPTSGWLADRFGARNVFALSICVFTVASVLCGMSQSLWTFCAARVLQGMGGALMTSVGRLIVFRSTPKSQLVRAVNWMTVPMLLGPTLGPPLGGFLTTYFTWRAGFFINVPIGLAGLILVLMYIPRTEGERRPFDVAGFLLNGAALASLIFGMQGMVGHNGDWRIGAALALASGPLIWLAWRHARTAAQPLVELTPLHNPTFRMTTLTGGNFMRIAVGVTGFFMPLLFQVGLGMTALASGLLVLTHMAGDLGAKAFTTQTVRRVGFRNVLIASICLYASGMMVFVAFGHTTPLWLIGVLLFFAGAARSFQMTGLSALQFADVPQQEMTAASTLSAVSQQAMRALGIAFAALLLNLIAVASGGSGEHLTLSNLQVAFAIIAVFALAALPWYLRLPHDAGSAVSGHAAVKRA
ncbi:MAG: MFS transporter [Phenylobacterium sp.]|uniref:MFS transporter n=1 Tax=Phenylobacterium sp. TaxID=1871053 RepID=UPI0027343421|nr:MFS transporter [Phenylobacterium sp.]MDP3175437.1 MFS transporter [Phenylobacterium sp.]